MSTTRPVEIRKGAFDLAAIPGDHFTSDLWPLVYILSDDKRREAYVGETTDVLSRMSAHLKSSSKAQLTLLHLITSENFNKSATLDIESNLIRYISGDGHYTLLNGNIGIANHTYFEKEEYWQLFRQIWAELRKHRISFKTLEEIDNSDLFKYSPYKALSQDQRSGVIEIIQSLLDPSVQTTVVEGGAGSGKTIVALYLFKLLNTELHDLNVKEFEEEGVSFVTMMQDLKERYPNPRMALVVPMSSFRSTLKKVFRRVKGLSSKMVIAPAEIADNEYDILIVDESHRLRRRVNLGAYFGSYDEAARKMGFDPRHTNELEWVRKKSIKQVLFYDRYQSIKPSDIEYGVFTHLKKQPSSKVLRLSSQFRVQGGVDYVRFITDVLTCSASAGKKFASAQYELELIDDISELRQLVRAKDQQHGLARLIAGYAWKWTSRKTGGHDFEIGEEKFKWNSVPNDWINSPNAREEVGCIHTTQGYDLNYAGIIFGKEIGYDKENNSIIIRPNEYHDVNGKNSIRDLNELKDYIINIYKTVMLRGIKGTFVYACDPDLREYFRQFMYSKTRHSTLKRVPADEVKPFVNAVPLYNFKVAAGLFTSNQPVSDFDWVQLPEGSVHSEDYFVCKVDGESMNRTIPNGSWCLFKKYSGGSRGGQTVLVQHHDIADPDFGFGFTVKKYHSEKDEHSGSWRHTKIILKPDSDQPGYKEIVIDPSTAQSLRVIGLFVRVLSQEQL